MYSILLIWGLYLFWYVCLILSPNSFERISDQTLEKQKINPNSKLRLVYFKKDALPQLK